MPWKDVSPMDERIHFISLVNESDESFSTLCERFGISRKTGYKWLARYEAEGAAGLAAKAPVARACPHRTQAEVLEQLAELRKQHPRWGARKLKARLEVLGVQGVPAASSIGEFLKRHGFIRPRRRRAVAPPKMPGALAEAMQPNDTWCTDFKGHFALGDRSRCHPLTITDQATRYLIKCEGLIRPDDGTARPHFERAFLEFGLPTRIRSDNGPPFASIGIGGLTSLSVWWIRLGITPERIDPGQPQQNGRHERMHRTLKEETATPPHGSMADQQRAFDRFRAVYNAERPHESLGMKPPAAHYTASRRAMPQRLISPEYPDSMKVRKLDSQGRIMFVGQRSKTAVSPLLRDEPVGLEPVGDDRWTLFYGPVALADVTLRNRELRFERLR